MSKNSKVRDGSRFLRLVGARQVRVNERIQLSTVERQPVGNHHEAPIRKMMFHFRYNHMDFLICEPM